MKFDPIAELNVSGSKIETEWLAMLDNAASCASFGKPVAAGNSPVAVVRVPAFVDPQTAPATVRSDITTPHSAEFMVLPSHLPAMRDRGARQPQGEQQPSRSAPVIRSAAPKQVPGKFLAEPPSRWQVFLWSGGFRPT